MNGPFPRPQRRPTPSLNEVHFTGLVASLFDAAWPRVNLTPEKERIFLPHETCWSSTMFRLLPESYHWLNSIFHSASFSEFRDLVRDREGNGEGSSPPCYSSPIHPFGRKEGVAEVAPYLDRPYFRSEEERERGSGWGTRRGKTEGESPKKLLATLAQFGNEMATFKSRIGIVLNSVRYYIQCDRTGCRDLEVLKEVTFI